MDTATAAAPAVNSTFFDMNTGNTPVMPSSDGLNPRATRYGFIPLWKIDGLPSNAFKLHTFPGSRFVPLRVFPYPVTNQNDTQEFREQLPANQVRDLYNVAGEKFCTDFPELAALENEEQAREIIGLLTNPVVCEKYPFELHNSCATCWIDYLRGAAPGKIAAAYADTPFMFTAAGESLRRLLTSLENAVLEAREKVNQALRDVDDPKTGKDRFYDVDYVNIMNTHQDMPKFRTTATQESSMNELAKAIHGLSGQQRQDVGLTVDSVKAMIAEATASQSDEIARLKAENEALRAGVAVPIPVVTADVAINPPKLSKGEAVIYNGRTATILADIFGKYKIQFEDNSSQMVEKTEVEPYVQGN